jgi:hypothetical protein
MAPHLFSAHYQPIARYVDSIGGSVRAAGPTDSGVNIAVIVQHRDTSYELLVFNAYHQHPDDSAPIDMGTDFSTLTDALKAFSEDLLS